MLVMASTLAACGSGAKPSSSGGRPARGGTVVFAEAPNNHPTYIFPFVPLPYASQVNASQFEDLLYRPLYWFGERGKVQLNEQLSLAYPPRYSDGGRVVTMTLKPYRWSDGHPLTSRDVEFWMNLVKDNKKNWGDYVPGEIPDNIQSMSYPNARTVVFHLVRRYNTSYYTYNELSTIVPIPQHAWDKTSASGAVGNFDRSASGGRAVFKFLNSASEASGSYSTDPLWQVVDGPWKMKSYSTTGAVTFVPNPRYSGPDKARLSSFEEVPFTSDAAEMNALRAGKLDYGYIPVEDLGQKSYLESHGYRGQAWLGWNINYLVENFTNPTSGPVFRQLYVRQAMQMLVDQPQWSRVIYQGQARPTYGPVPVEPANPFASPSERQNPYPFDPKKAKALLASHGWAVHPGGVTTCQRPGSGPNECGADIPKGAGLSFRLQYVSGQVAVSSEMDALQSNFSGVGMRLQLSSAPFGTIIGNAHPCTKANPCHPMWDMENWGEGWFFWPDIYPSGDALFQTGGYGNYGGYSSPEMDRLIMDTETNSNAATLSRYQRFAAKELPVLFLPVHNVQYSVVKDNLHGVSPQDPIEQIYPETWYFSR